MADKRPNPKHRRRLRAEKLEARRCLAASLGWDGPGQGSAELTYYVGNAPSSIDQAAFESAIEVALEAWSDVVDIQFTQVSQPGLRDSLDFKAASIDGSGGTLAQAYLPDDVNPARVAGDVEFDASESWEIGNSQGRRAFDLVQVAVHEIGHAIGIDHLAHSASVLAPYVSPTQSFSGLTSHDIDAALELYAPATAGANDTSAPNSSGSTATKTTCIPKSMFWQTIQLRHRKKTLPARMSTGGLGCETGWSMVNGSDLVAVRLPRPLIIMQ